MSMFALDTGGHWYDRDGKPEHDADLRVARKKNLYRSVTSIDKDVFKNAYLEQYKVEQVAKAAFEYPRQPHEGLEDYMKRIIELSWAHANAAGEFGTNFHKSVENFPAKPPIEQVAAHFEHFWKWKEENIIEIVTTEKKVVDHDICVAGTMDTRMIHKVHGLVTADFKTQGIKPDAKGRRKPNYYQSWVRQLSFYDSTEAKSGGSFPRLGKCLSIVIDSNEPSPPHEKLWSAEEVEAAYEDFVIAAYAYYKQKNYWPNGRWKLEDQLMRLR